MRSKIDPTLNYIGMYTFFGFSPVIYDTKKKLKFLPCQARKNSKCVPHCVEVGGEFEK